MLGAVLVTWRYWGVGDESDYQAGADAVDMALRLDPNLSLAYAVRGEVQTDMAPDRGAVSWEDSLDSYYRAIEHDGTAKNTRNFIPSALLVLKAYDKIIADNTDPPIWWARDDAALASA